MEFSGDSTSVYAEAKGEYTRQLCQYLTPVLQKYFLDMIEIAKERESEPKKHLISFQTLLEAVSEWNVDKVQRETQAIAISTQCDYLEELLTAVFIAHTKVLSAIRLTNKNKKLQITIPKLEHFLHRTLTECSRLLWRNTFLFATTGSPLDRQKNMCQIENLIKEGILQGVRTMLPVKSILREYLSTDDTDEEEEEEEEEEKKDTPEEEKDKPEEKKDMPEEEKDKPEEEKDKPEEVKEMEKAEKDELLAPTGSTQPELNFTLKEFDIEAPPRSVTPPRPATPRVATPPPSPRPSTPAIPTIVFDEPAPEPPVALEMALEEFDTSIMGEATSLDFTEFEEL